jgi:hypothetical protein
MASLTCSAKDPQAQTTLAKSESITEPLIEPAGAR